MQKTRQWPRDNTHGFQIHILLFQAHFPHSRHFHSGIQLWFGVVWRMYGFPSLYHPQKLKTGSPNHLVWLSDWWSTDSSKSIWTLYWFGWSWSHVTENQDSSWLTQKGNLFPHTRGKSEVGQGPGALCIWVIPLGSQSLSISLLYQPQFALHPEAGSPTDHRMAVMAFGASCSTFMPRKTEENPSPPCMKCKLPSAHSHEL